jgi:hypothetical protein
MQIIFLQMLKHAYWFDSLIAPNFDNVTTSSICFRGIVSLNFANHSYVMLLGEYKYQLRLFYGPTRVERF